MTFAMIKKIVAAEMACSVDSSIVVNAVNEAQDRLIKGGKWKGCYQKYRFCVNDACITLPREVEGIEAFAVECIPGTVRSEWFEFLENGPGLVEADDCIGVQLLDRGLAVAFDDVRGTGKKLAVYSDVTEATGAKIVLRFYNNAAQWVRTQQDGVWQDGEEITLPPAGQYAYTVNECAPGGLVAVIKPVTNGFIRLYEYTVAGGALKPLGYYAPTEQVPQYRRALVPDLPNMACGATACDNVTVSVLAKLTHIPVVGKDNDLLIIRSMGAMKLAAKAIKHEAANDFQGAAVWWANARNVLDEELKSYLGDGAVQPMRTPSRDVYGASVPNLIG